MFVVRRFFAVLAAWLVLLSLSSAASAQEPAAPRDVPVVAEPSRVVIPAVPADFAVKDLSWMRVAYPPSVHERVEPLLRAAEDVKARLADELGQPVLANVEVRIARTPEDMAALAPVGHPPPAYASGVAYTSLHLVLLTLQAPGTAEAPDLEEVFRHELAHVALEDAVGGRHVPRWFNEGLAVFESGESSLLRARTLWDATLSRTILPLADLDRGFPSERYEVSIAYAESADFVRFLLRAADRGRFASLIERVRAGASFDRALADAYGTDLRKLEYEWREELSHRYSILPVLTGGSLIWVLLLGLMIVGYVRRRRRAKAKLAEWEREESAMDLAAAAERARAAQETLPPEVAEAVIARPAAVPMVEHDGDWHTLH